MKQWYNFKKLKMFSANLLRSYVVFAEKVAKEHVLR